MYTFVKEKAVATKCDTFSIIFICLFLSIFDIFIYI